MTFLRLAHIDIEGITQDAKVKEVMAYIGNQWSACLYNAQLAYNYNLSLYFSPERELLDNTIAFSQKHVHGTVNMMVYKGAAHVLSRSAPESNFYSDNELSMDSLDAFGDPSIANGYIAVQGIRLEKYGAAKIQRGEPLPN
ncbi:hypothetical protein F4801DRAFT_561127 [Xylaria longipes]|nr:hypothetical protein F4801DRAFT_561127 [Xylaria longipes]